MIPAKQFSIRQALINVDCLNMLASWNKSIFSALSFLFHSKLMNDLCICMQSFDNLNAKYFVRINVDVIYHHLDAVCLVERKNYEFFAIDLLPVCLSTCHDSETFNFLCCATYINLAVHLSKVSILCLYFMYIYRCICYGSLNAASCSRCSVYTFIHWIDCFFGLSEKFN